MIVDGGSCDGGSSTGKKLEGPENQYNCCKVLPARYSYNALRSSGQQMKPSWEFTLAGLRYRWQNLFGPQPKIDVVSQDWSDSGFWPFGQIGPAKTITEQSQLSNNSRKTI